MQSKRNGDGPSYRERAKLAADAAEAAENMGEREIASAYRDIEQIWLKLAQQNDTLQG